MPTESSYIANCLRIPRRPALGPWLLTLAVSRKADQAHIPNRIAAKWFGSPSNAWARRIDLPQARENVGAWFIQRSRLLRRL